MGIPGVEYFAHAFELHPRIAKEFLFLGERMNAERACTMGMVNRVTTRDALATQTRALAHQPAAQPRMALALTKPSLNHVADLRGHPTAKGEAFGRHH